MSLDSIFQMLDKDQNNVDIITNVLNDMKTTSYDFLYEVEKNLCGVVKLNYSYNSPYIEHENSYEFVGRVEFVSHTHRKKFKDSGYYGSMFDITFVINNPDMFPRVPLVFINGDLYTNIQIQPNEDTTNFFISGINKTEFKTLHDKTFKMSILLIPIQNMSTGNRIDLLHISDITLPYITDTHYVTYENNINGDYYTKTGRSNDVSDNFIFFINNPSDQKSYKRNLFKMINHKYETVNEIPTIIFNTNQLSEYNISANNTTKLIHLNNYLDKIYLTSTESYFELPILDLPIPTENMIAFEKVGNGWKYVNNLNISKLYPSTYKVENTHNDLLIYVLYDDGKDIIKYKHFNELSLYYRFVVDIFTKYKDATAPSEILNYNPQDIFFDINNFYNSIKSYSDVNDDSLMPTYKINELNRINESRGDGYLKYLKQLTGNNSVYYIRTETIANLDSRIRYDNTNEIINIDEHVTFYEPHYLFRLAYMNDYEKIRVRLFAPRCFFRVDRSRRSCCAVSRVALRRGD